MRWNRRKAVQLIVEYEEKKVETVVESVKKHETVKIYAGARVRNCILYENVTIGDFALIDDCIFENNVMIQRRDYISGTHTLADTVI